MKTIEIKKNKKLPKFITSHKIYNKNSEIKKIFTEIGIKPTRQKINLKLKFNDRNLKCCLDRIMNFYRQGDGCCYEYDCNDIDVDDYWDRELEVLRLCLHSSTLQIKNKSIVAKTTKSPFIKQGFNFSKILNNLYKVNEKKRLPSVIGIQKLNVELNTNKNLELVFSTNPYDIATMSMRGITSCMSWYNDGDREHNITLNGSVIDPCVGIIYITNKTKTPYGEAMLYRSVVRIVSLNDKPAIFIERLYDLSNYYYDEDRDANLEYTSLLQCQSDVTKVFKSWLEKQTNLPIYCSDSTTPSALRLMRLLSFQGQESLEYDELTYSDAGLKYNAVEASFENLIKFVKQA